MDRYDNLGGSTRKVFVTVDVATIQHQVVGQLRAFRSVSRTDANGTRTALPYPRPHTGPRSLLKECGPFCSGVRNPLAARGDHMAMRGPFGGVQRSLLWILGQSGACEGLFRRTFRSYE